MCHKCGNVKLLMASMNFLSFLILNMATSSRAPWHVWTKKEEDTLVECLVDLVVMEDGNPTMVRSDKITWHNWHA